MNEEPPLVPIFGDYDFLDEKFIKTDLKDELFISRQTEDLILSKYIIKDYDDDPYRIELNSEKEPLLNIIQLSPRENSIYKFQELEKEPENKYIEYIKPKSELLGKSLSNLVIKNFIQTPLNKQNQLFSKLPPLSSSILNGGNVQRPFGGYVDFGATKPEDLPEMALPVMEFMEEVEPHIVIGCDRGGRLFGLAIHAAWGQTREGRPFPTLDGKLHFARVSKSEDPDVLQEKIDQIVAISEKFGKQSGNKLAVGEQLRVLFIDDWVIGGGTMRLAQRLMEKHNAQTYFAVMCGEGADATGQPNLHTHVSWHDRPEEIGVNYLSAIQENPDGTISQGQEVLAVRGVEAIRNRQRIHLAAKSLNSVQILEQVA